MVSKQHITIEAGPIFHDMHKDFNLMGLQCKAREKFLRRFISRNDLLQINSNICALAETTAWNMSSCKGLRNSSAPYFPPVGYEMQNKRCPLPLQIL